MKDKKLIRQLVSRLIYAAGCNCCRDDEEWSLAKQQLAELLEVELYSDKSGYDFKKYINE